MCPIKPNSWLSQIAVCNEMAVNALKIRESFQAVTKTEGGKIPSACRQIAGGKRD